MYCSKCGNQFDSSSRFCPACGAAVSAAPPPLGYSTNSGQLFRPLTGRMIGGVCAAFALRYGWDVTLTRVITALLTVCTGIVFGILAYIAAWIIIPEAPYPVTKSI
jgi:phage shock protein C